MKPCSNCREKERLPYHSYCADCHNAYARETRPIWAELSQLQKLKANARAYAHVYRNRGKLIPAPCEECGAPDVEMHHPNYMSPLCVVWLCRDCHLFAHEKISLAANLAAAAREREERLAS